MDMGRYLVEAHLREGRSVASLARDHGLHRSWIYKLLARYRAEGEAGLAPRSKRPLQPATVVTDELESGSSKYARSSRAGASTPAPRAIADV